MYYSLIALYSHTLVFFRICFFHNFHQACVRHVRSSRIVDLAKYQQSIHQLLQEVHASGGTTGQSTPLAVRAALHSKPSHSEAIQLLFSAHLCSQVSAPSRIRTMTFLPWLLVSSNEVLPELCNVSAGITASRCNFNGYMIDELIVVCSMSIIKPLWRICYSQVETFTHLFHQANAVVSFWWRTGQKEVRTPFHV